MKIVIVLKMDDSESLDEEILIENG